MKVTVAGTTSTVTLPAKNSSLVSIGEVQVKQPGYIRLDFQGTNRQGATWGNYKKLLVQSDIANLKLDFVRDHKGNRFYRGRRGPSVHLEYTVPCDLPLEDACTELTVPEGQDTMGSYFMANGFREGSFGMQVNSASERCILCSV